MLTTAATLSRSPAVNLTPLGIFCDASNNEIKTVTVDGTVDTFATGFDGLFGIVKDSTTGYYISNSNSHTIMQVSSSGSVTRYAGVSYNNGIQEGVYPNGKLWFPKDLVKASNGTLYTVCIPDEAGTPPYIAKIAVVSGNVTITRKTFIPIGSGGNYDLNPRTGNYKDWKDGNVSVAMFGTPRNLCVDNSENLYFIDTVSFPSANPNADLRTGIRKITAAGVVSTIVYFDFLTGSSDFELYYGLTCAPDGTLFFGRNSSSDTVPPQNLPLGATEKIYQRTTAGVTTLIAGSGRLGGNQSTTNNPQQWVEIDSQIGTNAVLCLNLPPYIWLTVNAGKSMLYYLQYRVLRGITLSGTFPVKKIAGNYVRTTNVNGTGSGASWNAPGQFLLV